MLVSLFLYANTFRISTIKQTTNAAYAFKAMQANIENIIFHNCHKIAVSLSFLITDMAMQIADNKENILPKIKDVCIKVTSILFF